MIFRCQSGYETLLARELADRGVPTQERGEGWLRGEPKDAAAPAELCFAHEVLLDPVEITGESVNALAGNLAEFFLTSARTERFENAWPLRFETAAGLDGLGRRADAVEKAVVELLKKKIARVARLAAPEIPRGPTRARGLFVCFTDFKRAFAARTCEFGGQRRMADDPQAPSRSFLKVEEAYGVLGAEPGTGETVVDLGAAPGGWSYSAAKRGARVIAVDNGPLKGGALNHPLIEHRREDAFRFAPANGEIFDWLFCDLVEEPHHVLVDVVENWISRGWCRRFVVNLKFGRVDPVALLAQVTAPASVLKTRTRLLRVRHLYHDREEFTLVGEMNVA